MAITLSGSYLEKLLEGTNTPNTVLEVALDSGTVKWGHYNSDSAQTVYLADGTYYANGSIYATGSIGLAGYGITAILKTASSLQNRLDAKTGYTTRGQLTATIIGRDNFKSLIASNYLKNRRVNRKDGFLGMDYSDYAATFTGIITDWKRKGDELTLTISDDMVEADKKIPLETEAKTQYIDYTNSNPVDVMTNILLTQLGIASGLVNSTQFTSERDNWLNGWKVSRVLTEPKSASDYLHELQEETNSFLVHDGEKISFKVFAPPLPTTSVQGWNDNEHILDGSLSTDSGYKDAFYNRVVVYYDYDESGSDKEENFEAAVIDSDTVSQGSAVWDEVKTKVIKSKWVRTYTFSHDSIAGLKPYHASENNGAGAGTITYTYDAGGQHTLKWTPPGGTIGEAVTISKDGKYQVFGADKTKYIRVLVTTASLPGASDTGALTLTAINGASFATFLARKILNRFRDPAASVKFQVGINNVAYGSAFLKPTDLIDLTTDEAFEYGEEGWAGERIMLTSVRPDVEKGVVDIEGLETKQYKVYGFIAPAGQANYGTATATEKLRAYIRTAAPQYHIW